ncbi:hypothetical protein E3A20_26090, partial [Planctomyces bekefii]
KFLRILPTEISSEPYFIGKACASGVIGLR